MQSDSPSLRSLCSLIVDCPHSTPTWTDTGFVVIRNQNIKSGRLDLSSPSFTDAEHFAHRIRRAKPRAGDIVITREAPMGEVCMIPEGLECCVGQRQVLLRPDPRKVVGRFLLYALQATSVQRQIDWNSGTGSTVSNLRIPVLEELKIPRPSLEEQTFIAEMLGGLDDQIDLLRQTNTTLEAIAQAIFKSWFIDFDPVHAKAKGLAPEGMIEATAALFPNAFEASALGEIPKGWTAGTLADLSKLNPESWTSGNHSDRVLYVDLANAKNNEVYATTEMLFDEAPSRARRVLRSGDTIVGTVRPGNRSFAFIHEPAANLTGSTGFAVLRPIKVTATEYVFLAATQDASIDRLTHLADGAAYPAVRPDVVAGLTCVVPPEPVLAAFHALCESLLISVCANQREAQTLADLRDTLLPRLISGKLRIPEAEGLIEEFVGEPAA